MQHEFRDIFRIEAVKEGVGSLGIDSAVVTAAVAPVHMAALEYRIEIDTTQAEAEEGDLRLMVAVAEGQVRNRSCSRYTVFGTEADKTADAAAGRKVMAPVVYHSGTVGEVVEDAGVQKVEPEVM